MSGRGQLLSSTSHVGSPALSSSPPPQRLSCELRGYGELRRALTIKAQSPPWGGVEYRQQQSPAKSATPPERHDQYDHYPLSRLEPSGGADMYELARKMTSSICMYLPRTIDLHEVASLVGKADRTSQGTFVNIEEQWLGNRCKALACYFGPLVEGSEL